MEFDVFLQKAGIDAEKTLRRFAGKAGILEKFVLKFPQDPSYAQLLKDVESGDVENMERSLHTFKGVTGNLGFEKLYELSMEGLNYVRQHHTKLPQEMLEAIQKEYYRVLVVIKEYDK